MSRERDARLLPNCTIILDQRWFKYKQPTKIGDTLGVDDSNGDIMSSSHCCRSSAILMIDLIIMLDDRYIEDSKTL
jgi:hypothetical protein